MFYLPGHSHNECDQRFVPLAAALIRSDELQTPDDPKFGDSAVNFLTFEGSL